MFIAGLTGGIASGKSTVSNLFQQAGAIIIDADVIARQVVAPQMPAWAAIVHMFGQSIILPDGTIDRLRLADIVFNDRQQREQLERIIHPRVRAEIQSQLQKWRSEAPHSVIIQDIPLLFETGMTEGLQEIVVVYVSRDVQLRRLMKRDGLSRVDAQRRIDSQMPLEHKRRKATILIDNGGKPDATRKLVEQIYQDFEARAVSDN